MTEPTVEQLLGFEEADPLSGRLDAVRHTAESCGVRATVDLHGRLLDLTIDHTAIRLPPFELAARIKAVSDQAAAGSLAAGLDVLASHDESLPGLLRPHLP